VSDIVNDFADLLLPAAEDRIAATLFAARKDTGVHIVLVTMCSTGDYGSGGQTIEKYAKNLFSHWGIGDAKRNDGVLILVAKDDRDVRIALGSGFDAAYDGRALRVIDTLMLPQFRNSLYAEGIEAGVEGTINTIPRPFATGRPPSSDKSYVTKSDQSPGVFLILGVAVVMFVASFARNIGDIVIRLRACPKCGLRTLSRSREIHQAATDNR
jgi:uncharacterized protein